MTKRNDDWLRTFVIVSITVTWIFAALFALFYPKIKIDSTVGQMMGAVVGYLLLDKFTSRRK